MMDVWLQPARIAQCVSYRLGNSVVRGTTSIQSAITLIESFYLNQLAAFAEIYDMLEEVCLGYDLPKAFTWANVNEIMYKKHTLFLQTTFCYPSDWWFNKDEHQQMQFIAGKALQSSEHFHFEENVPLSDDEYDAVAICLENYYKIDDVYVVEFLWPKIETELQESKSLALLIFNDLKNMKKKFVTVRSQFKVLNEQEEVIPKFHQHPLQLLLNDEQMSSNQSRVGDCWGCGEKVSAPCFSCVECGFYIHQKCAEAPFEIHHPFHLDHPLLLQKIPFYCDDGDQCICHFCDKTCERFVYHCSCGLNFHIKCVLFTYDKLKELEHVTLKDLLISPEKNGEELQEPANCFACWEPLEIYAYFSPDCGFNLHKKCADLPLKINDMGHEHPLALQLNNAWHICKKCCCVRLEGFIYCCSSCNYFVHIDCVRLPPNVEVKNHQHPLQLLNEQEELIRNFRTPLPMLPPVLHEQGIQRISNPPVVDDSNPKVGRNSEQAREDKIHTHSKKRNQKNIKGRGENTSCEPLANTENDVVKVDVNNLPMSSAKRRRRRNADIWEEFDLKIIDEKEYAICRHCSTSFDGSSKKGTTHLRNHLKSCKKRAAKDRDKQLAFPIGRGDSKDKSPSEGNSLFDQDRSSMNVARLIIKHQFPLNIVEDGYFRILLNDLQPMFKLQSQEALSSDVVRVYEEEKSKLFDYFDTLTCRFNLTTSLWIRDIDNTTYCCYAVQFIDHNWELKKKILALRSFGNQLDKRIFYESFKNFLVEWNLDKKVCSLTTKNSSSCFEIAEEIRKNWSCFEASHPLSTFYFSSAECIHDLFSRDTPSENIGKSDGVMYSNARLLNNIPDIYNKMSQQDGGRGYPLMNVKSDNNLRTCSLVLAIAVVLDPRLKFDFVEFSYNAIYDRDTARIQLTVIRNAFTGIFNEYASNMYSDTNSSTLLNAEEITMESFHRWYNSKRVKIEATSKTELDKYFQEPVISANPEFDILDWWRQKASSFPILRRMACDILAIPMPSVLSGSSFTEKVMMENPIFHGLNPQIIEAMICSRDWLDSSKQNDSANNVPLKDRAKRKMEDRNSNYGETSSGEKPKASYCMMGTLSLENVQQGRRPLNSSEPKHGRDIHGSIEISNSDPSFDIQLEFHCSSSESDGEITWKKQGPWCQEEVRTYLVSGFTEKEKTRLNRWQGHVASGKMIGRDKEFREVDYKLRSLLIVPHDVETRADYYIDDSIVNIFFKLLKKRSDQSPKAYVNHFSFDSQIATYLIQGSRSKDELLSWFKNEKLDGAHKLFLPSCLSAHWILFFADTKEQKFSWFDSNISTRMSNDVEKEAILSWFRFLLPFFGYNNAHEWPFELRTDIPVQHNLVDCGLFVMKYADCLTHGDFFPFTQKDMAHFRLRTFLDIYRGRLHSQK
ncbi:hypothetical protein PTKIN_Ptkin09bG0268300 [Pterospermum kingtungense]